MAGNVSLQAERRLRAALAEHRGRDDSQIQRWRTALTLAFYGGDFGRADRTLRAAATDVTPVVALDQVLAPALHDIGLLWERNAITTADEHLATGIAHRLVAAVAMLLERSPAPGRASVLLATPRRSATPPPCS